MDKRVQALETLKQVHAILVDRLVDRINETREDLIEDAEGQSFRHEIDALQEQLGAKLAIVSQLMAHCPEPLPLVSEEEVDALKVAALPTASPAPVVEIAPEQDLAWEAFQHDIRSRNVIAAGQDLVPLFGLPLERAELAASHFLMRVDEDATFAHHAQPLIEDLHLAAVNDALEILYGAFGLEGDDALSSLATIRPHLAKEVAAADWT